MNINNKISLKISWSDLKKTLGLTLIIILFVSGFFAFVEPGVTQAASDTKTVVVNLVVGTGISLTLDNTTTNMTGGLGLSGNTAVATSTFTVATNNVIGYTLTVQASSTAPAMQMASSTPIPDGPTTPFLYGTGAPFVPPNQYAFGFSAYSTTADVNTTTYGTGATGCSNGTASSTPSATLKYRGFAANSPITIAQNGSTTTPAGNPTVVCFLAAQNNSYVPSGSYTATITATATTK